MEILSPECENLTVGTLFDRLLINTVKPSMTPSDKERMQVCLQVRVVVILLRPYKEIQLIETVNYLHSPMLGKTRLRLIV